MSLHCNFSLYCFVWPSFCKLICYSTCLFFYLSNWLSFYFFVCLIDCFSISLFFYLSNWLSSYFFVCLIDCFFHLSVFQFVCFLAFCPLNRSYGQELFVSNIMIMVDESMQYADLESSMNIFSIIIECMYIINCILFVNMLWKHLREIRKKL